MAQSAYWVLSFRTGRPFAVPSSVKLVGEFVEDQIALIVNGWHAHFG
ncbi:MAG: hypothetical protein R3B54_07535 [Bdellovibrionota bacterium]